MFPRPLVSSFSSPELTDDENVHKPSTSTSSDRKRDVTSTVDISSDEDDQLMSDLATRASFLHSESDDVVDLTSDESFEPDATPRMTKSAVIDSIFNIPKKKDQYTNVWITNKSNEPSKSQYASPGKFEEPKKPIPSDATPVQPQHMLNIGGVEVHFPVKPYSCQIALMFKVITGITKKQNCLLESPTGSGKTLALLCGALAWQRRERGRISSAVEQQYFSECMPQDPQEQLPAQQPAADSKPFVRTLFGERSIYDGVKNGSGSASGDSSPGGFKRPEALRDFDDTDIEDGLVKIHKRAKLSGGGDQSPARAPQCTPDGTPQKLSPGKHVHCTPEKSPGPPNPETPKKIRLPKIYYGARTHKQIQQVVKEFKRTSYVGQAKMTILSSREYSCIKDLNRSVYKSKNDMCRDIISSKTRKNKGGEEETLCENYNNKRALLRSDAMPPAWDLEDLVSKGREIYACPYYAARALAETANIVFCPYNYLIDPGIRNSMQIDVTDDIVILDEAHNIEDVCREAASLNLTRAELIRAINELEAQGVYLKNELSDHIARLLRDLKNWDYWFQNQVPLLKDTAAGGEGAHTWQGRHFAATLDSHNIGYSNFHGFADSANYLANAMRDHSAKLYGVTSATAALLEALATTLGYLFRDGCAYMEDFKPTLIKTVTHRDESYPDRAGWRSSQYKSTEAVETMTLHLQCMNPAVVFAGLASACCTVLSSGTLTPAVSLHSELGSSFPLALSTAHVIPEDRVWIGSLLTCPDGTSLECNSKGTDKITTQDALGRTLLWVCSKTPNGVLCFLPSYTLMNKLLKRWQETNLWRELNRIKHVFMESRNVREHSEIMEEYYSVVGSERGALLIAVYRGKVSEGMDFKDEQARAVITVGIPYPNTFEPMVANKMKYNDAHKHRQLLPGREWLRVQAYRALNQAVGRCVRHRADWGAVLLVDARFQQSYYTEHLSKWVRNFLGGNHRSWSSLVNDPDSLESFMQSMTIKESEDHS